MPDDPQNAVARARRLAADLLAPAAAAVEEAGAVPTAHLDALAAAGLHGLDPGTAAAVAEELAAGDLATTFVWLQHQGVVRAVADGPATLRDAFLDDLRAGRVRAGIVLQAAVRPGPPAVRVRREDDVLVLDGAVPWVTGWGLVDVLLVAARDEHDDVLFLLVDAEESSTLTATVQRMVAVQASASVELAFAGHRVPAGRLVRTAPLAQLLAGDAAGLRFNGSLALGLVLRCARLLGPSPLDDDLVAARAALDVAGPAQLPAARAEAAALAHRAAGALVVATGSRALLTGSVAERTGREALFLLVFGSRPAIRTALLGELAGEAAA